MPEVDYVVELDLERDGTYSEDVTALVRGGALKRGGPVSGPFTRANTATGRVALSNGDAAFDPTNLAGPHVDAGATLVKPRAPWRILGPAHDVEGSLRLSGSGAARAADNAALTLAGDLDIRLEVTLLPYTPGGTEGASSTYRLLGKAGALSFSATLNGLTFIAYAGVATPRTYLLTTPLPWGRQWLRVTLDLTNGAVSTATFYRSDDGAAWTTLGSDTEPIIASLYDSNGDTLIGGALDGSGNLLASPTPLIVHTVDVVDGAGAAIDLELVDVARRSSSVTDALGTVFTLEDDARIVGGTGRPVLFTGRASSWELTYPTERDGIANLSGVDARDELAGMTLVAQAASFGGDTTNARLNRILDAAGWTGPRVLDPGVDDHGLTTLAGNAWGLLQLAADSAGGELSVDAEGALVFRQRHGGLVNPAGREVALTLADDGTGVPYRPLELVYDAERRLNRAIMARAGGAQQVAQDAAAILEDGPASYERNDLDLDDDDSALALAGHLVGLFARPRPRVGTVTVDVQRLEAADAAAVLAVELGARVALVHTPPGAASPWESEQFVRAIDDAWSESSRTWSRTFTVEDAAGYEFWIVEDLELGLADVSTVAGG